MNHLYRSKVLPKQKISAKAKAAVEKARAWVKLAYRQGRSKQALTGDPAKHQARMDEWDIKDQARLIEMGLKPLVRNRLFADAHQRGMSGLRFDGSTPKLKHPERYV